MNQNTEEKNEGQKDSFDEKDKQKIEDSKVKFNDPLNTIVGLVDVIKNIFR